MGPKKRQLGESLLGVIIGFALLLLLLGGAIPLFLTTSSASQTSTQLTSLTRGALRALDRMVELLTPAGASTLPVLPGPPLSVSDLTFRRGAGYAAETMVWGGQDRIALVADAGDPPDGVDNDGDGLTDEADVVVTRDTGTPDERSETIVSGVPPLHYGETANGVDDNGNGLIDEPGLSFTADDGAIAIRLTLMVRGPGTRVLSRTLSTSVTLRN